ncbi:MAG: SDR family oxidoreductase [Planctomycetaceae bacterium]|nr:SDR family oxidoreductase [Planctomycetaceae bacterium]
MSKQVVITGCTRGLGRALTSRFTEAGWTVIGCGRSDERIAELRDEFSSPHRFDVVDVSDDAAVEQWANDVIATHGAPDLLLNNAGLMNPTKALWEISPDEFNVVMNVNVTGTFHVLRHFLPAIIDRGAGVVVNFSSGWGRSTAPEVAPYCASKFAVEGLTHALAQELPHGIAAVALNPGIIDTDMLRSCWDDSAGQFPPAEEWSHTAAPFLMKLSARDNGRSLTVG